MAKQQRVYLRGADELSNELLKVNQFARGGVITRAMRKAARVMVPPLRRATPKSSPGDKSAKAAAKNPPGTLRKATGLVVRQYKGGRIKMVFIGHRWPKGAAAHLVDQGTKERFTKTGRRAGKVTAANFVLPIFDQFKSKTQSTFASELKVQIQKALDKAAAKTNAASKKK